jgi:hypothetical protein
MYYHERAEEEPQQQDIERRRVLLKERLKAQIHNFNKKLLIQNVNIAIFLFMFPVLLLGVFYLFGTIITSAAHATQSEALIGAVDWLEAFIKTNSTFHLLLIGIGVFVIIGIVIYHFNIMINFSTDELNLASYILAATRPNFVTNYQKLRKQIEFRKLSYTQMDNVVHSLQRLKHIHVEEKETQDLKTIIRDSNW